MQVTMVTIVMMVKYMQSTYPLASGGNLTTTLPSVAPGNSMNLPMSSVFDLPYHHDIECMKLLEIQTNILVGHCCSAALTQESLPTNENHRVNFG